MHSFFYLFLSLCFLFFSFTSFAQSDFAKDVMLHLTNENMHGRGYVNDGDRLAANYIAEKYAQLNATFFDKNYFQDFNFSVNTFPDSMRISLDGKSLIPGTDYIVGPDCPSLNMQFSMVYCYAQNAARTFKKETDKSGKIFVFDQGELTDKDSLKDFNSLVQKCATQAHCIRLEKTKLTWSVSTKVGAYFYADVLRDKWNYQAKTIELNVHSKFKHKHTASNVVGFIPGKKKGYIVLTAHYDHLGRMGDQTYFPGANDNASGVAQLLSVMQYYSKNKPKYTIVFIAFAGEEAGLLGSKYFVEHPLFDLKKIKFLLNLDIMGTGEEGITVVNATKHPKEFKRLQTINTKNNFLPQVKSRGEAANSDHYFFSQAGVPAFFIYTLGGSKAYHDVDDQMSGLSFSKFDDITRLLIEFIKTIK